MATKKVSSWLHKRAPKVMPKFLTVERQQSAGLKATVDPIYEPVKEVVVSDNDSNSGLDSVAASVPTPPKSKRVAAKLVATPIATSSNKADPTPIKKGYKTHEKGTSNKKQTASQRYAASSSNYTKFCDEHSKNMWHIVCQRKILSERLINVDEYEKAGVYKLLSDRKLLVLSLWQNSLIRRCFGILCKFKV